MHIQMPNFLYASCACRFTQLRLAVSNSMQSCQSCLSFWAQVACLLSQSGGRVSWIKGLVKSMRSDADWAMYP